MIVENHFNADSFATEAIEVIIGDIVSKGYAIVEQVFTVDQVNTLLQDIKKTSSEEFHPAAIGRDTEKQTNSFIRRDRIHWLDSSNTLAKFYFDWIEQFRLVINQKLFLGLFDYECHYAHYPETAFYKKHLDAFKGQSNRKLTTILYLNSGWMPEHGGELVLYDKDSDQALEKVMPVCGRMVFFLSEEFPHEVLPANRSRYSLTGWFRVSSSH